MPPDPPSLSILMCNFNFSSLEIKSYMKPVSPVIIIQFPYTSPYIIIIVESVCCSPDFTMNFSASVTILSVMMECRFL